MKIRRILVRTKFDGVADALKMYAQNEAERLAHQLDEVVMRLLEAGFTKEQIVVSYWPGDPTPCVSVILGEAESAKEIVDYQYGQLVARSLGLLPGQTFRGSRFER